MPPKKAPKKGGEDERDFDAENYILQKRIEVLQVKISGAEQEAFDASQISAALELKLEELRETALREEDRRANMTVEMGRQHSEMEESFTERIKELRSDVDRCNEEIAEIEHQRQSLLAEKEAQLKQKDVEIAALGLKIDTMGFEFAEMMRVLYGKICERVEVTHTSSDASKPPLLGRMAEMANK